MNGPRVHIKAVEDSIARSERWTAIASTLVAIAILAAGVTASQHAERRVPTKQLSEWESDLRFQVETVFRKDVPARDARLAQLDSVLEDWENSPQTALARQNLIDWFALATANTMPGSAAAFPAAPKFGGPVISETEPSSEQISNQAPLQSGVLQSAPPATAESTPTVEENPFATVDLLPAEPDLMLPAASSGTPTLAPPAEETKIASTEQKEYEFPSPAADELRLAATKLPREAQPVNQAEPVFPEQVGVNLTELAARIAGYHDALDEVEMALLRSDSPTAPLLQQQLTRLENLVADYQFVTLYYQLLDSSERRSVLEPRSLEPTLRQVAQQLDRFAAQSSGDFLDTFDNSREQQQEQLREQFERLESILRLESIFDS